MNNIQLSDIIYEYCRKTQKYLVHYKLNYNSIEERNEILDFYKNKIDDDYWYAMKNDDESFFEYENENALIEAQLFFPTNEKIYAEYGENSPLYISVSVYNKDGICEWQNVIL
jgi:hypothetical protein